MDYLEFEASSNIVLKNKNGDMIGKFKVAVGRNSPFDSTKVAATP